MVWHSLIVALGMLGRGVVWYVVYIAYIWHMMETMIRGMTGCGVSNVHVRRLVATSSLWRQCHASWRPLCCALVNTYMLGHIVRVRVLYTAYYMYVLCCAVLCGTILICCDVLCCASAPL